ncbi:hypothetical protein [Paracidovorax citrulli]
MVAEDDGRKSDADGSGYTGEPDGCPADRKDEVRARRWLAVSAVAARRLSPSIIRGQKASIQREMVRTARQLMREFGRPLTLRRLSPVPRDAAAGRWPQTGTEFKFTGTLFDYPATGDRYIQRGDKQCFLVANGSPAPVAGDLVVSERDMWKVIFVKTISPAGRPVLYELHVRR